MRWTFRLPETGREGPPESLDLPSVFLLKVESENVLVFNSRGFQSSILWFALLFAFTKSELVLGPFWK